MSEPRIGRVLVASLHQAIADIMPTRLEFYENWLSSTGLREGTIGLAAMTGALGFLRREPTYRLITTRAGEYAATWTMAGLSPLKIGILMRAPRALRMHFAMYEAGRMVRATYPGTRPVMTVRTAGAAVDLRGSLFCGVREAVEEPLCGFYSAAFAKLLELVDLPSETTINGCRAVGDRGCLISIVVAPPVRHRAEQDAAVLGGSSG
jgi:hypothetical protein